MRCIQERRIAARRRYPAVEFEPLEGRALLSTASFRVLSDWGSGFTGEIKVINTAATPVNNWKLEFDYAPSIGQIWDGRVISHVGTHYVIAGAGWNNTIAAGGKVSFGFNAGPGNTTAAPTNWKLNGVPLGGTDPTPPPPLPTISIADVSLNEGDSGTKSAVFAIQLSAPSTQTVTVNYNTGDGTARSGEDYQAASGALSFAPGQTTKSITVKINGDTQVEPDETFTVSLSGAANATIARTVATGTIQNDDTAPAPPPSSGGNVQYAVTNDWGSGFQAQVTITNTGATALTGWTVEFDLAAGINSLWDAQIVSHVGNHYVVKSAGWNDAIAAGGSTSFGFTAGPGGASSAATNFVLKGNGGGATQPTTPLPPGIVWPASVFAPYVDMTLYPMYDLAAAAQSQGVKFFTLAFITADPSKRPAWGGYAVYGAGDGGEFDTAMRGQIAAVRALGGDVMVSFGGAANQEMAEVLTDINALKAAYKKVIDAYDLTNIDFDIEGAAQSNKPAVDRRSQALAALQQEYAAAGKTLAVHLTLPVLPTGLTAEGLYVLQSALSHGVTLAGVNIMAMDYGDSAAPSPSGKMGDYAIQAATSTFNQLKGLYGTSKTDAQVWALVGVTPMIGMNDVQSEVFDQNEARELLTFAQQKKLGLIAFWSLNRDRANANGAINNVENTSSSLAQTPYEFTLIFKPFTSS